MNFLHRNIKWLTTPQQRNFWTRLFFAGFIGLFLSCGGEYDRLYYYCIVLGSGVLCSVFAVNRLSPKAALFCGLAIPVVAAGLFVLYFYLTHPL